MSHPEFDVEGPIVRLGEHGPPGAPSRVVVEGHEEPVGRAALERHGDGDGAEEHREAAEPAAEMVEPPHGVVHVVDREDAGPEDGLGLGCLLYTSPSPRDATLSRMPSSA